MIQEHQPSKGMPEDLFNRTRRYAQDVRVLVKLVPRTISNIEDGKQAIRSSGSVAANYIESREAISKKDAVHRLRICRKETRETGLWLELFDVGTDRSLEGKRATLRKESDELTRIFSAILQKLAPSGLS